MIPTDAGRPRKQKTPQEQLLTCCHMAGAVKLARTSLYPMAKADGNHPAGEQKEPSDVRSSFQRQQPRRSSQADDARSAAYGGQASAHGRSQGGPRARTGHPRPRGGDPRHRSEGDLPIPQAGDRPLTVRRDSGRVQPGRRRPHRLPESGFPWSPSSASPPDDGVGGDHGLGKLPRRHHQPVRGGNSRSPASAMRTGGRTNRATGRRAECGAHPK